MTDLVSIIIPTYYRNDYLQSAIESVFNQTYEPIEIIVVDDSGERHAEPVFQRLANEGPPVQRFKYVDVEQNVGPQLARQRGLSVARGEFIQFFDDDDMLREDSIERRVKLLTRDEGIGVAYSGTEFDDGTIVLPSPDARGDVLKLALQFRLNPCTTSNMLIREAIMREFSPLDDSYTGAGDIAIQIELARRADFEYVNEALLWSRRTEGSLGVSDQAVRSRMKIIHDYSDLYSQFPPETRNYAISDTCLLEGRRLLRRSIWSPQAISAFLKAAYFAPELTTVHIGELLSSLGGQPLRRALRYVR